MQFQIKTLAQYGSMPFQDYKQFIELCDQSSIEDKAKLAEFYMHILMFIDMNVWDSNANLVDLQLLSLASWMNHEEARAVEMKKLMEREEI